MGYLGSEIGNYRLLVRDSLFDYVKQNQRKEYYQKKKITFEFIVKNISKNVSFPFLTFCKLKKNKKKNEYSFTPTIHKSDIITKLLFKIFEKKKIKLSGFITLTSTLYRVEDPKDYPIYYLQSELNSNEITLTNKSKLHIIKSYEDLFWIIKNGLNFKQID